MDAGFVDDDDNDDNDVADEVEFVVVVVILVFCCASTASDFDDCSLFSQYKVPMGWAKEAAKLFVMQKFRFVAAVVGFVAIDDVVVVAVAVAVDISFALWQRIFEAVVSGIKPPGV